MRTMIGVSGALLLAACGGRIEGASDAGGGGGAEIDAGDRADAAQRPACDEPDMLFVLDRTMSMHRMPDGNQPANTPQGHQMSKWHLAVTAIEEVTQLPGIRFGLELFPLDPGGALCVTLEERLLGTLATNSECEAGEVVHSPSLSAAAPIASSIDTETTRLCWSTPIGAGLATASQHLQSIAEGERSQFAVLVTDGKDTCDEALVLSSAHAMAQAGIGVYAIGFDGTGGGVDRALLNHLACAGHTAPSFPDGCTDDGAGNYTATDPDGPVLFQIAQDAEQLSQALQGFASEVCCGCID
jgi:hypothetical protein